MAVSDREIHRMYLQLEEGYKRLSDRQQEYDRYFREKQQEFSHLRQKLLFSARMNQDGKIKHLERMEEELRTNYIQEVHEMKRAYQAELDRVKQLEFFYHQSLERLSREQRRLAAEIDRKDRRTKELADCQERALRDMIREAVHQPVEVFYPHRLQHYLEAGKRARALMEEGMYSLAANDYSNICMGIRGLMEDTNRKKDELNAMFEQYRFLVTKADLFMTSPWELKNSKGEVSLALEKEEDLDYWSDGLFYAISESLKNHRHIAYAGTEEWIREHSGSKISLSMQLEQQIRSLETLPKQMELCISYALSACDCYNYLIDIREKIISVLAGQNYQYDGTFFGERNIAMEKTPGYEAYRQWLAEEACVRAGGEPDYREERCLRFHNPEGNQCEISLVPIRTEYTVACKIRLRSRAELHQEQVGAVLQSTLERTLGQTVEMAEQEDGLRTSKERFLTAGELKRLAAVPQKERYSAQSFS